MDSSTHIQALQQDVIDLLKDISKLMGQASEDLKSEDYERYQQQINEELRKVENQNTLGNDVVDRKNLVSQESSKLTENIDYFKSKISDVQRIRENLKIEGENKKKESKRRISFIIDKSRKEAEASLKKTKIFQLSTWKTVRDNFSISLKKLRQLLRQQNIDLPDKHTAEKFASEFANYFRTNIPEIIDRTCDDLQKEVKKASLDLPKQIEKETKDIIEEAKKKLEEDFSIVVHISPLQLEAIDKSLPDLKPEQKRADVFEDFGDFIFRKTPNFFRGIFKGEIKQRQYKYVVPWGEQREKVRKAVNQKLDAIQVQVDEYIDNVFEQEIDKGFKEVDVFLDKYEKVLEQARSDKNSSKKNQESLQRRLNYYISGNKGSKIKDLKDKLDTKLKLLKQS